jgi:hypothetical protein
MMGFWFRELMGWLLVLLGLAIFAVCFLMLQSQQYVETAPMTVIGIFVFRGGLHLLKVAVAARICLRAQETEKTDRGARDRLTMRRA